MFFADDVIQAKLAGRKIKKESAKWYIIYPDDKFRGLWDFLITL